jgi:hypothetical protein
VPGTPPDVPECAGALPMAARLPTFAAGVAVEAGGDHLLAPHGDFAPVDYPYGSAVVFTRTFRTS